MMIAPIMKGEDVTMDHILIMDESELSEMIVAFDFYCNANKRKKRAKKMLKQFEDELQIY